MSIPSHSRVHPILRVQRITSYTPTGAVALFPTEAMGHANPKVKEDVYRWLTGAIIQVNGDAVPGLLLYDLPAQARPFVNPI